jgi:hypothetical protein
MQAYIHTKEDDGKGGYNCYLTQGLHVKETETPRSGRTASGYGRRIPTSYMVMYNRVWRRVYCVCFSNTGTLYIGKTYTPKLVIDIQH